MDVPVFHRWGQPSAVKSFQGLSPPVENRYVPFPARILAALDQSKILGIRAGTTPHRFIGIWVVVVDGRVFVRSYTLKPDGWYHTLLKDPRGTIQVGSRTIKIRAVPTRSTRLRDAVDRAYAAKYPTPGSRKFVVGFRRPRRKATTTELVPLSRP